MKKYKLFITMLCLCLMVPIFQEMKVNAIRDRAIEEMVYDSFYVIDENGNPQEVKLDSISSDEKEVSVQDKYEVVDNVGGDVIEAYATEEEAIEAATIIEEETDEEVTVQPFNLRNIEYGVVYINTSKSYTEYKMVGSGQTGYISGSYGRDGAYIGTFNGKVRVKIAGVIADFNMGDVDVVDYHDRRTSYYIEENGYLMHYYLYGSDYVYGATRVGYDLDYLESDVKYYSYDGHYFYETYEKMIQDYQNNEYTQAVNATQPYYNYYQYLSHRSISTLTAEDFDNYTKSVLKTEAAYQSSKFCGLGQFLLNAQNTYTVNAMMIYGVGANESNIGRSSIALNKNNLFGHSAYDENPYDGSDTYESVEESVNVHAYNFISRGYLDYNDWRHNGPHLGDKEGGINVRYASDPYWGEKAACRVYYLGEKPADYGKDTVGIIQGSFSSVSLYNEPSASAKVITNLTNLSNFPVLILDQVEVDGIVWYKIASDTSMNDQRTKIDYSLVYRPENDYLYIQADKVLVVWEGTNSEIPEVPENPETPELPETPETPELPEEPEIVIPELEDGHQIQLNEDTFIVQTKTTVADLKLIDSEAIVAKGDEVMDDDAMVGTGYTITIYEKTYTIIKIGDVNGDGQLTPSDYVKVKNHIMQVSGLTGEFLVAADMSGDGVISPSDYVKIKNTIMGN